MPRTVVAIGKCAGALLDGFGDCDDAFVAVPKGYPRPSRNAIVYEGGHPEVTDASFAAGAALLEFVHAHREITFLVSGGGSACVEWPRDGYTKEKIVTLNSALIRSGKTIGEINAVRKQYSAIKNGALTRGLHRSVTLVYSDVSRGALADVASGPSIPADEVQLVADNDTLTDAASAIARDSGFAVTRLPDQIEDDVQSAARRLAVSASQLRKGEMLIAGGEPTVVQHGDGRGGRCSELAVRFALEFEGHVEVLFGSSDGVDGSSGSAGVMLRFPASVDREFAARQLEHSNAMAVIERFGEAIPLCPTGNNLRDLYLLACS
jgi:glycerate-2-kinase